MATIKSGNFCFRDPTDAIKDGDTIAGGNFSQLAAGTEILKALRLTITGGNWCNVKPQPTWTITGGSWAEFEYCSHESPELVAKGLKTCASNCKHRSAEKSWRRVKTDRFKELKDNPLTETDARVLTNKDHYGLPAKGDGDLEQYTHTYHGTPGRSGTQVLAAREVG